MRAAHNKRTAIVAAAAGLVGTAAGAAGAQEQAGINVSINGEPIPFAGQPPVQRGGAVLVPLRGVFEKLGASVQFDPVSRVIVAVKGERTITLRLGDSVATVDDQTRTLSTPAQAENGTTLVPLRFVSEALGAEVKWDGALRTVRIVTEPEPAANTASAAGSSTGQPPSLTNPPAPKPQPTQPAPPQRGPLTGTLTASAPDALTLRLSDGREVRVGLGDDPVILVQKKGEPGVRGGLADLRTGDQVTLRRDGSTGRASVVEALYDERRGEVKLVQELPTGGGILLTLADGQVVELVKGAPVRAGEKTTSVTEVAAGSAVAVRVNPQTGQGLALEVLPGAPKPADKPAAAALQVSSLSLSTGDAPLRAGESLTVTLRGTPGATATFTVPGLPGAEGGVAMKETEPGVYVGRVSAPENVSLKDAAVLASLSKGGTTSNTIQAGQSLTIDGAGPTLAALAPANGASENDARPLIYGTYSDIGSGIDRSGVRVQVNGQDVTAQATVTEAFFSYRPAADLPSGESAVVLTVRDRAGNMTERAWKFRVSPSSSVVRSISVSPAEETLGTGDTLIVRIEAPSGGQATFSVGGAIVEQPMEEEGATGRYSGSYPVKKGDSVTKAPVTVTFKPAGAGAKPVTKSAPQSVTIAAGAPGAPVIETPREGASAGESVVVSGRAAPGATVRVTLRYSGKLVVVGTGGTVASAEVRADSTGRFRSEPIQLKAPRGVSSLSYTLEVVTIGADGDESAPATIRFKR